ncbi:Rhodanese-related sulfurtransferase [Burkholderiales bacterium JOSHI_001]|nr:Rhodanese-related sulfurtransferase [Burkholderiales bacterium JOSHI_001]
MRQLAVTELKDFIAQAPEAVLLDVREPWEVATAALALPGVRALNIPMQQLPARLAELPAEQPILALCHHGMRSMQCVAFLVHQGFEQAYNVGGGIDAWSRTVDPSVPRY